MPHISRNKAKPSSSKSTAKEERAVLKVRKSLKTYSKALQLKQEWGREGEKRDSVKERAVRTTQRAHTPHCASSQPNTSYVHQETYTYPQQIADILWLQQPNQPNKSSKIHLWTKECNISASVVRSHQADAFEDKCEWRMGECMTQNCLHSIHTFDGKSKTSLYFGQTQSASLLC